MERNSLQAAHESANVFDDEFAVDDYDLVADGFGFAPEHIHNGLHDEDDGGCEPVVRSVAAHMSDMPMTTTTTTTTPTSPPLSRFGPTRSSIQKTRGPDNPFMSAEDEDDDDNKNKTNDNDRNALGRTASLHSQSTVAYAPGITHRSLSSASSHPFAPMHSPVLASSGPSHPYAMYPQDSFLARTASVSTTSTIRAPQRASLPQQGPAHPYAMYPQNVVADVDDAEEHDAANPHPQDHIPIGFPGRAQAFQRQQGPEGEEQDIVGADGHAEQLPPYSEYPENGVPKHIVLVTPISDTAPLTATPSHLPVAQGGPQSMTDASARADAQSFTSMEQMESNQTRGSTPKRWKNKSWKEKRKTKFCGIPFWWIMLSGCVLAFIAVVLGGAIGGFLSSQKKSGKSKKPHQMLPSSASLYDASPIPTSSTGTPPPTGTYALSLGAAEATQTACLTNQSYSAAWDCHMPDAASVAIQILYQSDNSCEGALLFDTTPNYESTNISYGTMPPVTQFSQFWSVEDNDDPSRGPAFYFQSFYDKLVVVPQTALPSSSGSGSGSNSKRSPFTLDPAWHTVHQIASGEEPWFCFWNGTFLEGFIYANYTQTSISSSHTPSSTSHPTTAGGALSSYSSSSLITSSPMQTHTPSSSSISGTSPTATSHVARQTSGGGEYSNLQTFGYSVKIEERRIAGSPQPYCQKMQILDDGTAGVVIDPNTGSAITVTLGESDPSYSAYQSADLSSSKLRKRSDTVPGGCHCQWWGGT